MPRYSPMGAGVLRPEERHPLLTATGRGTLNGLLEDPGGPRWNHQCGDRLDGPGRAAVQAFAALVVTEPPRWTPERPPSWLASFVDRVSEVVPRYRRMRTQGETTSRRDLVDGWWELVPDDAE